MGAGLIPRRDRTAPAGDYRASGSGAATEDHYKWAAEGYRKLGALAEELGFRMAFETHMECLTDLPEPTKKLLDMIDSPAVGANLDYGNMIHFANVPSLGKAISILRDRLYMVHLKNAYPVNVGSYPVMIRCPLGDGMINNRQFMRILKEDGFQGPHGPLRKGAEKLRLI